MLVRELIRGQWRATEIYYAIKYKQQQISTRKYTARKKLWCLLIQDCLRWTNVGKFVTPEVWCWQLSSRWTRFNTCGQKFPALWGKACVAEVCTMVVCFRIFVCEQIKSKTILFVGTHIILHWFQEHWTLHSVKKMMQTLNLQKASCSRSLSRTCGMFSIQHVMQKKPEPNELISRSAKDENIYSAQYLPFHVGCCW